MHFGAQINRPSNSSHSCTTIVLHSLDVIRASLISFIRLVFNIKIKIYFIWVNVPVILYVVRGIQFYRNVFDYKMDVSLV